MIAIVERVGIQDSGRCSSPDLLQFAVIRLSEHLEVGCQVKWPISILCLRCPGVYQYLVELRGMAREAFCARLLKL